MDGLLHLLLINSRKDIIITPGAYDSAEKSNANNANSPNTAKYQRNLIIYTAFD